MISFPNGKINIGLQVLGKRPDGYHNIETVFYPIGQKDALEIIDNEGKEKTIFTSSGIEIDEKATGNLCVKAYDLLKNDFPQLPPVCMHLHKSIPLGAGLGGGSSDAVFTLKLLNKKYALGLNSNQLAGYALILGSDCPFFLINKPCFATGRGELLEEINLDLSGYKILLVHPGIHINTGLAFATLKNNGKSVDLKNLIKMPVQEWKLNISNDFEEPVFNTYPQIKEIKEGMYEQGALYAAMSGSGSSVFGIFKQDTKDKPNFPADYFYKWV